MPELLSQANFLNLSISDLRRLAASGQSKTFNFYFFILFILFL